MPNVILSSKLAKTDSIFLEDWIKATIFEPYHHCKQIGQWLPIPFLIGALPLSLGSDLDFMHLMSLNPDYKRFVRVIRFHKVENYNVYATIRDSRQSILCHFTSRCVLDYEQKFRTRITYNSANTLFVIGNVNLEFWNAKDCMAFFGLEFPHLRMVPVLRVDQAQIFDRDQIVSTLRYPWAYDILDP